MRKKKLILIFEDFNSDIEVINSLGEVEILALSIESMLFLKRNKIAYVTTDDFFPQKNFQEVGKNFIISIEKSLKNLDKKCFELLKNKFLYSSNSAPLIQFLLNLYFIEKLCSKILKLYSDILIISRNKVDGELIYEKLDYNYLLPKNNYGINKTIKIFMKYLNAKNLVIKSDNNFHLKKRQLEKVSLIIGSIFRLIFKKIFTIKNIFTTNSKDSIFVIRDGYELDIIKDRLLNYKWIFSKSLRKKFFEIHPKENGRYDFSVVNGILEDLIIPNFNLMQREIIEIFKSYHKEIISRIPKFNKYINKIFITRNVKLVISSVGTADLIDFQMSHIANLLGIKVVNFQHGGTSQLCNNPFAKYVEENEDIDKTLITSSRLDFNSKSLNTQYENLGSIAKYKTINSISNLKKGNVLYIPGNYPLMQYRHLLTGPSEKDYFKSSYEIIYTLVELQINFNIKPHPETFFLQYKYFSNILDSLRFNENLILGNVPVEKILNNYDMIITDYVSGAITSTILGLNKLKVFYLSNLDLINNKSINDLKEVCYLIGSPKILKKQLIKYKDDNLRIKHEDRFVDKYIYPLDKGHPLENIKNYLKLELSK